MGRKSSTIPSAPMPRSGRAIAIALRLVATMGVFAGALLATPATAQLVYVFQGQANTVTERVYLPCGENACDHPDPPDPTDIVEQDVVREFQNVSIQLAFVMDPGASLPFDTWEGEWFATSRTLNAANLTTTTTTRYATPALDTVVVENESTVQDHGPLYRHAIDGGPTFSQMGVRGTFIAGQGGAGESVTSGVWRWDVPGPGFDPSTPRQDEPVTPIGPFSYRSVDTLGQPDYQLTIAGVSNLTLSVSPGTQLPPPLAPPSVPIGSVPGTALLLLAGLAVGRQAVTRKMKR